LAEFGERLVFGDRPAQRQRSTVLGHARYVLDQFLLSVRQFVSGGTPLSGLVGEVSVSHGDILASKANVRLVE